MGKVKNIAIGMGLTGVAMTGASYAAYETGYLQESVYPEPLDDLPPESPISDVISPVTSFICFQELDPNNVCDQSNALVTYSRSSNHIPVTYNQVNASFHHSLIIAEDQRFIEKDDGIYEPELANAFAEGRGGSGITEQLARTLYRDSIPEGEVTLTLPVIGERTVPARKVWEIFKMSPALKETYTDEEIIEKYDNTVYFGCLAYGIGAASLAYYDTTPDQLDYAKSATLAVLVREPSMLDGYDSDGLGGEAENQAELDELKLRRNELLQKMDEPVTWFDGSKVALTQQQIDAEIAKGLEIDRCTPPRNSITPNYQLADQLGARHFVDKVITDTVNATEYTNEQMQQNTRIMTTLDLFTQSAIKESVYEIIADGLLPQEPGRRLSVVVLRNDGSIAGYYVGDYQDSQVDLLQAYTPIGSHGKPVILAQAKEEGIIDESTIFDDPESMTWEGANNGEDWIINGGNHCSEIEMICDRNAILARSPNPPFLQLMEDMGTEGLQQFEANFSALGAPRRPNQPIAAADVLGAGERTPLGLATANNSLYANDGAYVANFAVRSLYAYENEKNVLKYQYIPPDPVQVFSPETAEFVQNAAEEVIGEEYRGTARKHFQNYTGEFAGKTGSDADLTGQTNVAVFGGATAIDSSNQSPDFLFKTTVNGEYTIFAIESHIDGLRPLGSGHNGGDLPALVTRKIADRLLSIPGVEPVPLD